MTDLTKYKVDQLILLVGGNPLPNAVAGKLLATEGGRISLIHSRATQPVAQRLRSLLLKHGQSLCVEPRQVEEASPPSISGVVLSLLKDGQTVGLNYTGGTKTMSVNAYRAVAQWARVNGRQPVYSYLDARHLELVFDRTAGPGPPREYVGLDVALSFEELLGLHGWSLQREPAADPVLPGTAQALRKALPDEAADRAWRDWLKTELVQKAARSDPAVDVCPRAPDGAPCPVPRPREPRKWRPKGELKGMSLHFSTHPLLADVVASLKAELSHTAVMNLGAAAQTCGYREPEDSCKWLDGTWLESAVLRVLKQLTPSLHLHDIGMSLEPRSGGESPTGFEFDVVAMRGYQLFAFSCSTDAGRGLLKLKLFEAALRARQLGGDEACAALVCLANDPEGIQGETRHVLSEQEDSGSSHQKTRVFGRQHLAELGDHIEQWIRVQSGGR